MVIQFEIHYDNPYGMYFAGQTVKGRAVVLLNEPMPTKGIRLKVHGFARVRWQESSSSKSSTSDTHFDYENFFKTRTEGLDTRGMEQILEPGTYTYTFESLIPSDCPSSFEGIYGRICYETVLTFVRPTIFNRSYSKPFNVLTVVDLNPFPQLKIPAQMEYIKTFCCGPCKTEPLILTASIPQTGYVPGDYIDVNVRLFNPSSVLVDYIRITLHLIGFYIVRTRIRTKTERIRVAHKRIPVLDQKPVDLRDTIRIPPTPPTCETKCQIIKLTYEVHVEANVKGPHLSPTVAIPVTIGNIPYVDKTAGSISGNMLIQNLMNGATQGPQTNVNAELPPPSYEEASVMQPSKALLWNNKIGEDFTSENFTPRYTFYNEMLPSAPPPENSV